MDLHVRNLCDSDESTGMMMKRITAKHQVTSGVCLSLDCAQCKDKTFVIWPTEKSAFTVSMPLLPYNPKFFSVCPCYNESNQDSSLNNLAA